TPHPPAAMSSAGLLLLGIRHRPAPEHAGDAGSEGTAFYAQLFQQRVDQWRLGTVAQSAIDDPFGHVRATVAVALGLRRTAPQPVDLQNLDALDLLHGPHALADDSFQLFEEAQPHGELARLRRQGIFRL